MTWAACDRATLEARGRCAAMTGKAEECTNWAVDEFEGKGYCGQHYASRVNDAIKRERETERRQRIDQSIERFLAWTAEHPSVHDRMLSLEVPQRKEEPAATAGNGLWAASSGRPFTRG